MKLLLSPYIRLDEVFKRIGIDHPSSHRLNGHWFSGKVYLKDKTYVFHFSLSDVIGALYFNIDQRAPDFTKNQNDLPLGYIQTAKCRIILGRGTKTNVVQYPIQTKK